MSAVWCKTSLANSEFIRAFQLWGALWSFCVVLEESATVLVVEQREASETRRSSDVHKVTPLNKLSTDSGYCLRETNHYHRAPFKTAVLENGACQNEPKELWAIKRTLSWKMLKSLWASESGDNSPRVSDSEWPFSHYYIRINPLSSFNLV